jgi:hypothetical protein
MPCSERKFCITVVKSVDGEYSFYLEHGDWGT